MPWKLCEAQQLNRQGGCYTIDELKTHLLGRKTPIRSLKPREVVQEIYGWLVGHWCIRCLIFQAAETAGISRLRIGFTGTLNVMWRAIPTCQNIELSQLPFFCHGQSARFWMKKSPNVRAEVIPALSKDLAPTFRPKSLFIEVLVLSTRSFISLFLAAVRA